VRLQILELNLFMEENNEKEKHAGDGEMEQFP
jgi:hypothetical protein